MSVVLPASMYRTRQKNMALQQTAGRSKMKVKAVDLIFALVGCIVGQASLLEGMTPFGVAYLAAFVNLHPQRLVLISLGVGIGSVLARGWVGMGVIVAALLGVYVIRLGEEFFAHDALKGLMLAIPVFGFHMLAYLFHRGDFYRLIMGLLEPMMILLISWLFAEGLTGIVLGTKQRLSRMDLLALLFLSSSIVIGLPFVQVAGIQLGLVAGNLCLLAVAYAGGISCGTVFGMFLGVILSLTGLYDPLVIGLYGFAGLMVGFFRDWGKMAAILGLVLTSLVFAGLGLMQMTLQNSLVETLVAGGLLFLVPNSVITKMRRFLPGTGELIIREADYQEEQQRQFVGRLAEISQVFAELGTTFKEVTAVEEIEEDDLSYFLYVISNRVCKGCEYASHCWDKQFYQTYTQIFKLLTVLENQGQARGEDFIRLLKGHCRNLSRLRNLVDGSLEIYELHRQWSQKLKKQQAIVAEQLQEVAQIISGFSKELSLSSTRKEDMERILRTRLEENGVKVAYCRLSGEVGDDQFTVTLSKERCMGDGDCRKAFQVISQMVDQPLTCYERECGEETGQRLCHLKYCPARRYKISVGVCGTSRDGEMISGDSYMYQQLRSGKFMTILSDGMGTGEDAARESKSATNLVQQIIKAGFNHGLAVRTVNSALLSRSTDECYATIDLSFVDLFTGELEMIKIGAVDSFIKRGSEVSMIRGGSLPAGILQNVEPARTKRRLMPGDFVVMMTDGIPDAVNTVNKEEWIVRLLRQCSFDSPEDLARYIFCEAKGNGPSHDDMTVVVLRLEEERIH